MSDEFKTCGEAWKYCEKYGLDNITGAHSFEIAKALLRAYKDGAKRPCTCEGFPLESDYCKYCGGRLKP